MANKLSLQSATCSAFQLQLCRQPHKGNDTKTVSSFGSDCTGAMQSTDSPPAPWNTQTHTRTHAHMHSRSQSHHLMRYYRAPAYPQTVPISGINNVREKSRFPACRCVCTVWTRCSGGVLLTALQWCILPPAGCTSRPPPRHCLPTQRRTDPGSDPGWWPGCLLPEVLRLVSPT